MSKEAPQTITASADDGSWGPTEYIRKDAYHSVVNRITKMGQKDASDLVAALRRVAELKDALNEVNKQISDAWIAIGAPPCERAPVPYMANRIRELEIQLADDNDPHAFFNG